jgi:predicted extracellular nuclease
MFSSKKVVAAVALAAAAFAGTARGAVVVNEVYGGGGNSGSTLTHDFIELYNNGLTPVDLSGYKIQYASATGAYDAATTTTDSAFNSFLTGSIAAGGFYTVREAQGTGGTVTPETTTIDGTPIALGATSGKVRLVDAAFNVIDRVSFGATATDFEGTGPAPAPSNTTSVQRAVAGVDTNQNSLDFVALAPTPAPVPEPTCLGVLAVGGMLALRRRRK